MDLNVKIGADVGAAVTGIDKVEAAFVDLSGEIQVTQNNLKKFETALKSATDTKEVEYLNKSIGVLKTKLETLNAGQNSFLKPVTKGINEAGQALTNVGRVASDLPFGFIGIQNNLTPLYESFERLKVSAGSNVGALKALASSLIGTGGIGLAISLASSAILLYQKYTQDSTEETKKNSEAIKLSVDDYDRFAAELIKVTEAMGTEAAKVSILFSALSDSNIGLRERKGIIEQLNQISPGYLGNLDKEKATYDEIAKAVFAYTESLAKSSEIKALLPQVDKLFQGLINAQVQLNQLRRFQGKDQNDPGFFGVDPEDFKKDEASLLNTIKNFGNQIKQAKAGLTNFAGGEVNLSEILFGKTPELAKVKEPKKIKDKIIKALKFKPDDLEKMFFDEATVKLKVPISAELDFKKSLVSNDPLGGLDGILGPQAFEELNDKAKLAGLGITEGIQDGLKVGVDGLRFPELKALTESATKELDDFNAKMTDILQGTVVNLFTQLAENLGSGESLFAGFTKILGEGLEALGKQMIVLSPVIKTLKLALHSLNPTLMLPAGIALVAIGAALSNLKIPGFAAGVTNFGGGLALVGERGPELVRLPKGSDVIPNHLIGGVGQSQTNVFIPDIRLRGNDLVVVFNRASQTIGRNG